MKLLLNILSFFEYCSPTFAPRFKTLLAIIAYIMITQIYFNIFKGFGELAGSRSINLTTQSRLGY